MNAAIVVAMISGCVALGSADLGEQPEPVAQGRIACAGRGARPVVPDAAARRGRRSRLALLEHPRRVPPRYRERKDVDGTSYGIDSTCYLIGRYLAYRELTRRELLRIHPDDYRREQQLTDRLDVVTDCFASDRRITEPAVLPVPRPSTGDRRDHARTHARRAGCRVRGAWAIRSSPNAFSIHSSVAGSRRCAPTSARCRPSRNVTVACAGFSPRSSIWSTSSIRLRTVCAVWGGHVAGKDCPSQLGCRSDDSLIAGLCQTPGMSIELVPLADMIVELDVPFVLDGTPAGGRWIFEVGSGRLEGERLNATLKGRSRSPTGSPSAPT